MAGIGRGAVLQGLISRAPACISLKLYGILGTKKIQVLEVLTMRLRHIPGSEEEIENSPYVVSNPEEKKGRPCFALTC